MRGEIIDATFRPRPQLAKLEIAGMLGPFGDRFANFVLRRLAKARQFRDATGFAGLLQLLDRADLQLFVERFDFFAPRPGIENNSRIPPEIPRAVLRNISANRSRRVP